MSADMPPEEMLDLRTIKAERIGAYGNAIGMDPEFTRGVQNRGMLALIERAEQVDASGAQARILAMTQSLGIFMQEKMERGGPTPPGLIADAMAMACQFHGVPLQLGTMLLGSVLEVFQVTSERLSETVPQDDTQTGLGSGEPAAGADNRGA